MTERTWRRITLNEGPSGLKGRVDKWKNWILRRLHYRTGQWAEH